jgi:uncharacterized protein (DUF934 family)
MSILVTDTGFTPDDWSTGFATLDEPQGPSLDISPGDDFDRVVARFSTLQMIRIKFADFADGRGFSIARRLRLLGYKGRLRAVGHVLADQYAMARRSGFDEVEIDADLAARQPQDQWLARANWRAHDYQSRLRGQRAA